MNLRKNEKGFTIVELLIVVVVIAILAAISIVAYTGITNRANRSAAMEAANAVKSVATTFQGTNSAYPTTKAQFIAGHNGDVNNAIAKLPSDIVFSCDAALNGSQSPKTVRVQRHPASGAITGFTIHYYDFVAGSPDSMTVGTGSGGTTFLNDTTGNCA